MTTTPQLGDVAGAIDRMHAEWVNIARAINRMGEVVARHLADWARAFAVLSPRRLERPIDRARRLRVERAGRAYQRRAIRRAARARRRAALGSAA